MSDTKSALAVLAQQRLAAIEKTLAEMEQFASFDWKSLPPNVMAKVLMKKPYRGKSNEPDYYLNPEQALVFAMRCFELGLSPLSSEVWFDRDRWSVNVTLEGKLRLAKDKGMNPVPEFEDLKRPWKAGAVKIAGYEQEPGKRCSIKVGERNMTYDCWLTEWYMPGSPVWKAKPDHMMAIRAYDKALAFLSGVGVSDMPSEREIQQEELPESPIQSIRSQRVEFKAPQGFEKSQFIPEPQSRLDKIDMNVPQVVDNNTDMQAALQASLDAAKNKKP